MRVIKADKVQEHNVVELPKRRAATLWVNRAIEAEMRKAEAHQLRRRRMEKQALVLAACLVLGVLVGLWLS